MIGSMTFLTTVMDDTQTSKCAINIKDASTLCHTLLRFMIHALVAFNA